MRSSRPYENSQNVTRGTYLIIGSIDGYNLLRKETLLIPLIKKFPKSG
jgi:hypothetical protein